MFDQPKEFKSILAEQMNLFLKMKRAGGVKAVTTQWLLVEFDNYAYSVGLESPIITKEFLSNWHNTCQTNSHRTLYAKYSLWRELAIFMRQNGYDCFIPQLPKCPSSDFVPYIFTHEQIKSMFAYIDRQELHFNNMKTALFAMPTILRMLYSTGIRVTEALSLKNADVHICDGYLYLGKTKNGYDRLVPICDSLQNVLESYIRNRNKLPVRGVTLPDHLFFFKPNGEPLNSILVYREFQKILRLCGIPYKGGNHGPRVHDLRHTFAVHSLEQMWRAGMELYTALPILSACLGHCSLHATEGYIRLTKDMYPEINGVSSVNNAFIYSNILR